MDEIKSFLSQLGLQKNEIETYCTLLQLGEASILEIALCSGQKRPTVYNMIRKLSTRGLVFQVSEGKKRYCVGSVESLRDLISRQQKKYFEVLPSLMAFQNVPRGTKPVIRYYEGTMQMTEAYAALVLQLNKGNTLYAATSMQDLLRVLPKIIGEFEALAVKKQWHICELLPANKIGLDYLQNDRNYAKKTLPPGTDLYGNNFMIIGELVFFVSIGDTPYALSIENKTLSASLLSLFTVLWRTL